ncbi:MAG: tetratricopeptide repeat protein [Panacagrimonas sp.]
MRAAGLVLAATLAVPAVAQSPLGRPAAVPAGPTAITPAERSTLQRAQQLLRSGDRSDAEQAHTLLAPLETQRSDEVDFSYLLGLAALGSGKTSEAIFALQRAVAGEPGFAGARLELARAYYEAGDNEDARREFERVAAQNPPPPARRLIEQYLEAIDRRAEPPRFSRMLVGVSQAARARLGICE